jgi:uncharacterized membrane protein
MNESDITIIAAGVALLMVAFVKARVNAEMRAAVRTTLVLALAWWIACSSRKPISVSAAPWTVVAMLVLSIMNLIVIWPVAFRAKVDENGQSKGLIDRINVGFACAFGILLIVRGPLREAAINALMILAAAFVLALKRN